MERLTVAEVRYRRAARSSLTRRAGGGADPTADLADLVARVGGIQAQDSHAAALGLSVRVDGLTRGDVDAALWERRALVRTWTLRGTMHLVPAAELSLWMAALSVAPYWEERAWLDERGLTARELDALLAAIGDALTGRELLREGLADEVAARVGARVRERLMSAWGELLASASRLGLLCHGRGRGTKATFVRADEWVGGWTRHDPRTALTRVFERYLAAFGPATVRDFERWAGVPLPDDVRAAVDVDEVAVGRRRCLVLAGDTGGCAEPPPVRLLPRYDCYVLGSYPRASVVPEEHKARLRAHPRGRYEGAAGHSLLLVDGLVAGVWERRDGDVRVEAYVPLDRAATAELEAEAARVGAFTGDAGHLSLGPLAH